MKRFHVHLNVQDLPASIAFYSRLFASEPARVESDYAKWMLADPPVNFAVSTRAGATGIDHLGLQAENEEELAELKARAAKAEIETFDEGATTCCYARSEKHWITDPQGIAWEHFHTLGNVPVYGETRAVASQKTACCAPGTANCHG
ncbi:glyoxalase/bleomycin resistance/dioxygenase family protein [Variovorax beijingensis]|uniref:Glyoxalase/bleomycin resistance/dioxygenase family protein n=1 Tax=Variovorax beijingensis TaxID=2496117 RepID=A0A3P3EPA3_9BURK|nr:MULTISPECIES: ArsI/CadI family heavy metal resistance metalloenzyme [Variovorax]RRH87622.1 glyoxalase/bleomycin resistance/dioxygenase family protein [Variovorax beijingensis]WPH22501.1 ArsI/CadI family heavy metal resistance metalloenzyme [Variovorax paradoxus]